MSSASSRLRIVLSVFRTVETVTPSSRATCPMGTPSARRTNTSNSKSSADRISAVVSPCLRRATEAESRPAERRSNRPCLDSG